MPYQQYLLEVEAKLKHWARNKKAEEQLHLQKYHGSQISHLGLSVPEERAAFKERYSFSTLAWDEQLKIWDHIWFHSSIFEAMSQALCFCESWRKKSIIEHFWPTIMQWVERVDNWHHSDGLSDVYSRILEHNPETVYPTLCDWNSSPSPWKKRASLLSLLYYSSTKTSHLPFAMIICLLENLLKDKDHFVQKAVGWTLRELTSIYPQEAWNFMSTHAREISSIAYPAAIKKLSPELKLDFKKLRARD